MKHIRLEYMGRPAGNSWATVHEPAPVHLDDMPNENCNVLDDVADSEALIIEYSNLNLNGKLIMNQTAISRALSAQGITPGSMATHRVPAGTVAKIGTTVNYTDPLDILEATLGNYPALLSRVLAQMAWMIDNSIIQMSQSILFMHWSAREFDEIGQAGQSFDDFCHTVAATIDHESFFSNNEGEIQSSEQTLAIMLKLSPYWHERAASATAADWTRSVNMAIYRPKSLDMLMREEKPRQVPVAARTKLHERFTAKAQKAADRRREIGLPQCKTHADLEKLEKACKEVFETTRDTMMQAQLTKEEDVSQTRVTSNMRLIPVKSEIIRTAQRHLPETASFEDLPELLQQRFTQQCATAMESKYNNDVAKLSAIGTAEHARMGEAIDIAEPLLLTLCDKIGGMAGSHGPETTSTTSQVQLDIDRAARDVAMRADAAHEKKAAKAAKAKAAREAKAAKKRITTPFASVAVAA